MDEKRPVDIGCEPVTEKQKKDLMEVHRRRQLEQGRTSAEGWEFRAEYSASWLERLVFLMTGDIDFVVRIKLSSPPKLIRDEVHIHKPLKNLDKHIVNKVLQLIGFRAKVEKI